MSYREYVPTCVETLFGRPPTKIKARVIIPESKTFNQDNGHCICCEKYEMQRKIPYLQEDFKYDCAMNCPDCHKPIKKDNGMRYNEGYRFEDKRVDNSPYDCYCTILHECTDEEYYPEEINKARHNTSKIKTCCSGPSRSRDSPDHADSGRFCSVCHLWVRTDSKEQRDEYSSKKYEDLERIVDNPKTKTTPCCKGYQFVVESCEVCGNRRNGMNESANKGEEHCQGLQRAAQSKEICDFFEINQATEPALGERDSCEEIYELFAEKISAWERYPEKPEDEDLIESNRQEDVLETKKDPPKTTIRDFKKAHSTTEISNTGKRNKTANENSEGLKEVPTEVKWKYGEKSPQNTQFRNCDCDYARRDWKAEGQNKPERDKSEIKLLKKKCDEALGQLELFKKDIVESKKGKCHCDMEFTMRVIKECKNKCAQLEKQVVYLQHRIDGNTPTKLENTRGNWEIRQAKLVREKHKKKEYRDLSKGRKQNEEKELVTKNTKVSRKPRSTSSPVRVRNIRCQHMKCFPPEQIPDIPSFKTCPGYYENFEQISKKR